MTEEAARAAKALQDSLDLPCPPSAPRGTARYRRGPKLGKGTFGDVYQAEDAISGRVVAVKKIRIGSYKEGVHVTALREIKLLQELKHENLIALLDVYPHKKNLHLVFEFCVSDLESVVDDRSVTLGPGDVKAYLQMSLRALSYCHRQWVLHRDIKLNNFLIAADGTLKLADFGLSRTFGSPDRAFTHQVFARWYRAPELLFGSKTYGGSVDVWAMGCVFAQILLRRPLFPGSSDIDQLGKIFLALGTPTEETWPGVTALPDYVEYAAVPPQPLTNTFRNVDADALDLLGRMLTHDPNKRITAQEALDHVYFLSAPPPTPKERLPRVPMAGTALPPPTTGFPETAPRNHPLPPGLAATDGKTVMPAGARTEALAAALFGGDSGVKGKREGSFAGISKRLRLSDTHTEPSDSGGRRATLDMPDLEGGEDGGDGSSTPDATALPSARHDPGAMFTSGGTQRRPSAQEEGGADGDMVPGVEEGKRKLAF